ncbi:MAG: class II fructose-bisphosphate aldolase family protein [Spirochaetaceae bacterium]|nr:class II fructose-bisphosphate aldolase family protein [Spirochaetaceae bacterium]
MIAKLGDLLHLSVDSNRVLCGFNVFGYEDALAVVRAGDEMGSPLLLMVNRTMADFMPPEICGPMLRELAHRAAVAVGVHLDHAWDLDVIKRALDSGFTSVMFDGSKKPLNENIQLTSKVRELADEYGASLEGEVGTVPYDDLGETRGELTGVSDVRLFTESTGVDVLAVSVGNVHRLTQPEARIDFSRLAEIEAAINVPLVIHGASGLSDEDIRGLLGTSVAKFNFGTRLRQAFGSGIREYLRVNPEDFDRLRILGSTVPHIQKAATEALLKSGWKYR